MAIKSEPTVHGYPVKRLEERSNECSINNDKYKITQNSISNKTSMSTAHLEKSSADLKNNTSFSSLKGEKLNRDEAPGNQQGTILVWSK